MKALTWQGVRDVQVTDVPDPSIEDDADIIVRVTSTGSCGSDLHLYTVLLAAALFGARVTGNRSR